MPFDHPPRISPAALAEVEAAFREYAKLVIDTDLSFWAQSEYVDRVSAFLRWLRHDFEPGARVSRKPTKHSPTSPPTA